VEYGGCLGYSRQLIRSAQNNGKRICDVKIKSNSINLICNLDLSHRLLDRWRAIDAMLVIIDAHPPEKCSSMGLKVVFISHSN